jgi:hypothetical protein
MNKKLIDWWAGSSYDSDAQAFFAAAGITDATQKTAVNTLVTGMKTASLWTKMRALYPMVGGTATTHKYNLKDPRDLDAAYRLVFTGSWTHSSTGALPDGATTYADTKFNATGIFTSTNGSMGYYSRTNNNTGNQYEIGNSAAADANNVVLICRYGTGAFFTAFGSTSLPCTVATADSLGFFVGSKTSGTNVTGFKNGASIKDIADSVTIPNLTIYLGASNRNGTATYFSRKECAFAFLGDTLSSAEVSTLNTLVQAYQTSLGRNV